MSDGVTASDEPLRVMITVDERCKKAVPMGARETATTVAPIDEEKVFAATPRAEANESVKPSVSCAPLAVAHCAGAAAAAITSEQLRVMRAP